MIGAFIPWTDPPRSSRSLYVGYVIAENGCHLWVGAKNNGGYGFASIGGGRSQVAHKARYEREVGPVPEGMELDHYVCNNRACCNPAHVRPVTPRENQLRSNATKAALNLAKTHCPKGHPLSGDNLYLCGKGRSCLTCRRAVSARWNAKVSAAKKLGGVPS
jgi:hypothetical protein